MSGRAEKSARARSGQGPLPDIIGANCRILFVGINPGLRSAELGHHYAGHGNRFWRLLFESGLIPERIDFSKDVRLPEWGLGLTNLVVRASRSSGDLGPEDFAAGRRVLEAKVRRVRPEVIAFVGITLHDAFFGDKKMGRRPERTGLAPERIGAARVFVLPNPSGRNAHYAYADMLAAYTALAEYCPP